MCGAREVWEEISEARPSRRKILRIEACVETGQEFVWVYRCEKRRAIHLASPRKSSAATGSRRKKSRWVQEKPQEFARAFVLIWQKLKSK